MALKLGFLKTTKALNYFCVPIDDQNPAAALHKRWFRPSLVNQRSLWSEWLWIHHVKLASEEAFHWRHLFISSYQNRAIQLSHSPYKCLRSLNIQRLGWGLTSFSFSEREDGLWSTIFPLKGQMFWLKRHAERCFSVRMFERYFSPVSLSLFILHRAWTSAAVVKACSLQSFGTAQSFVGNPSVWST